MAKFFSSFPQKTFPKGTNLISPNCEMPYVYFIEEGIVRAYLISSKGNDITFSFYKKGYFFPLAWIINRTKSVYYYEAFTDIVVRVAPSEKILSFLEKNNYAMNELLKRVYREAEVLLLQKEYLIEGSARNKLALSLVVLAKKFGDSQKKNIEIPFEIDESNLASLAGLTRETISRELMKFQKEKAVIYDKKRLTVKNLTFLENLLDGAKNIF